MLFVTIGRAKLGMNERVPRRVNWQYPAGVQVVGEYWLLGGDPALIVIAEADPASLMAAIADWDDAFDFTVVPAITAEQGLELSKQMLAGASTTA
jgi:hypothetical protein